LAWPPDEPSIKDRDINLGPGLEIRGQDDYVTLLPRLCASGTCYEWVSGRAPGEIALAEMPNKEGGGQLIVVDPGENDKRLFVLDEEFAAALQCTKREGNTLSTNLRNFWDSGNVEPLTKTSKIKTTGAHVCLVTHITALELNRYLIKPRPSYAGRS